MNNSITSRNRFVDLSIQPMNCDSLLDMALLMRKYGYIAAGVPVETLEECVLEKSELHIFPRLNIVADSIHEMRRKRQRNRALKVLYTENLSLFRHAANLRGIDVIRVKPSMAKYLDKSQANLLKKRDKIVELSLPEYLSSRNGLYRFSIAIRRMYAYDIPFALASDSSKSSDVWRPDMITGLLTLIGIPEPYAELPISTYPLTVVNKLILD